MLRRQFLVAGAAGVASSIAGCSSVLDRNGEPVHPFADSTVTVRVDNNSDTGHDVEEITRDALQFWEVNSRQYAGFDVEFELEDDDPDVIVAFADDPSGCEDVPGFSERVLGCAPVLSPGSRPRFPVTARVVAGKRPPGKVLVTTQHEIGHLLGLGHDDEPREIMSNRPSDRIPMYDIRISIWEAVQVAHDETNEAIRLHNIGRSLWDDREDGGASELFGEALTAFQRGMVELESALEETAEFENHPRVETVALEELRTLLGRLIDRVSAAIGFSRSMRDAADARNEGDQATVSTRLTETNEYIQSFNEVESVELRDVAIALGLVRGFEQDDPVVGEAEEEV